MVGLFIKQMNSDTNGCMPVSFGLVVHDTNLAYKNPLPASYAIGQSGMVLLQI